MGYRLNLRCFSELGGLGASFFVAGVLNIFPGMWRDVGEVCIFADGGWAAA